MYERLTKVVNELERVVFSLDKDKPRRENEALAAMFFRIFRDVERIMPEYEEVKSFPSFFDELDVLEYPNIFFVDWNSKSNSYTVRWDEERRVWFLKNWLQALVWGLVGKALKYMPQGGEALAQAYEDLLNGLEEYTDTDTLEILYQLSLDKAKAYTDYMSVKEKYKDQIKALSFLGFRQILSLLKKNGLNYAARVKVNDWWSKICLFSQLDTALLNEFDSFALQLLSLDTLVKLEKIYRKKGLREVQALLSPSESGLNGMEMEARIKGLSKILGKETFQRLKGNPALIPPLKEQLESCIVENLQMLEMFTEKKLESCLKTEENRVTRIRVKDPPIHSNIPHLLLPNHMGRKKRTHHPKKGKRSHIRRNGEGNRSLQPRQV